MSRSYLSYLEEEVRIILNQILEEDEEDFIIVCSATGDGMSSGIPGAFADAIDRSDLSEFMNERFHVLIAELRYIFSRESSISGSIVEIQSVDNEIYFAYKE